MAMFNRYVKLPEGKNLPPAVSGFPTVVPSTAPGGDWDQARRFFSLEDKGGRKRTGRCFLGHEKYQYESG